jgi:hypothetical protein
MNDYIVRDLVTLKKEAEVYFETSEQTCKTQCINREDQHLNNPDLEKPVNL